jgi:hypothetical protein
LPYLWLNHRSELADLGYAYPSRPTTQDKEQIDCNNTQLATILKELEVEVSTCTYGVNNYLKAMAYRLLAHLELLELRRLWRSNIAGLSSQGRAADFSKAPSLCNTMYGSLLEKLAVETRGIAIMGI